MDDEDEHIGPYNGHYKSEALPNGCIIVVLGAFGFMFVMAATGFIIDWFK